MANRSFTLSRKWRWQSAVMDTRLDTYQSHIEPKNI